MNNTPSVGKSAGVLEKIRSGQIKIRPRYFCALQAGLFSAAVSLAFLLLLFLSSFMLFFLRSSGSLLLPGLGWQGSKYFLLSFPWMILLSLFVFAVVFEFLIWRFPFVYHWPVAYSAVAVIILTFVFGAVISYTPFHASAFERAEASSLPVAGGLYRYYSQAAREKINFGSPLMSAEPEKMPQLETFGGQIFEVAAPGQEPEKGVEKIEQKLKKSEAVMIFGKKKNSQIQAIGIREIKKEDIPFLHDCRNKACHEEKKEKENEEKNIKTK